LRCLGKVWDISWRKLKVSSNRLSYYITSTKLK